MGKKDKDHRKKVAKRNEAIKSIEKKIRKGQEDRIMEMIRREKEMGLFDASNPPGPIIDLGQGPQI